MLADTKSEEGAVCRTPGFVAKLDRSRGNLRNLILETNV